MFEPKRGASAGRNAAIKLAKGEIIAVTDDDTVAPPNWLTAVDAVFAAHPDVAFAGGRLLLGSDDLQPVSTMTDNKARFLDKPVDSFLIWGANMAFRRSAIESVGTFDERMGPGLPLSGDEDNDLIFRMIKAGMIGRYSPEIVVWHHYGRRTIEQARQLMLSYGAGEASFLAKWLWKRDLDGVKIVYWIMRDLALLHAFSAKDSPESRRRARARLYGFTTLPRALITMRD